MNSPPVTQPERPREPPAERVPRGEGAITWEHGRLFARYVAGGGERPKAGHADDGLFVSLSDQLALRLCDPSQSPLQAVLYLPRLGRIHLSARRELATWDIALRAEEAPTSRWLVGARAGCEDRLARALGQPVRVQVIDVDET